MTTLQKKREKFVWFCSVTMFPSQWTISLNNLLALAASTQLFVAFSRASSQQPWWESNSLPFLLPLQLISTGPSVLYFPGKQVLEIPFNAQPCTKNQLRASPEHRAWLGWKWAAGAEMMGMCWLGYPHCLQSTQVPSQLSHTWRHTLACRTPYSPVTQLFSERLG